MNVDEFMPNRDERFAHIVARIPKGWGKWVDVGKGWYSLVLETDRKLAEIEPNYEIHQIKEKFGELRYYISHECNYICGGIDNWRDCKLKQIIDDATKKSITICEVCGEKAEPCSTSDHWYATLCENHRGDKYRPVGEYLNE